jgi:hypothetical protein
VNGLSQRREENSRNPGAGLATTQQATAHATLSHWEQLSGAWYCGKNCLLRLLPEIIFRYLNRKGIAAAKIPFLDFCNSTHMQALACLNLSCGHWIDSKTYRRFSAFLKCLRRYKLREN